MTWKSGSACTSSIMYILSDPGFDDNSTIFKISPRCSEKFCLFQSERNYPAKIHYYSMLKTNKTISESKFHSIPFCTQNYHMAWKSGSAYTSSIRLNNLSNPGFDENSKIFKISPRCSEKFCLFWNFPIYPAKVHCYSMLKTNKTISESKFRSIPFCAQN